MASLALRVGVDCDTQIAVEHQWRHLGDFHGFGYVSDLRSLGCCKKNSLTAA